MLDLATIFHHVQRQLFPVIEEEWGPLQELDRQFCGARAGRPKPMGAWL